MKLALVTQDFPPELGGIQTYSWELARRFHRSVDSFVVITATPATGDWRRFDSAQPFEIVRCAGGSDWLPLSVSTQLPQRVRSGQIDTVYHAQWQSLHISARLRHRNKLRALFVAAHGRELLLRPFAAMPWFQARYDAWRRRLFTAADCVFPVSHFTQQLVLESGGTPERCLVVPNGTDPNHYRPVDSQVLRRSLGLEGRQILLFAGRLVPNKGLDTVILGLSSIVEQCPHTVLLVIGEGTDQSRLQQLAQQHGLHSHVRFLGRMSHTDLPSYYSMADVFVTLSRSEPPAVEGFGLVFLEANACGTPVIGARSGGIPDAIVDGETGFLVDPQCPEQFSQRALELLKDPALRRRLGENGRQRVLEYAHWDAVHDRILNRMRSCLSPTYAKQP